MRFWLLLFNWENTKDLQSWPASSIVSECLTAVKTYQTSEGCAKENMNSFLNYSAHQNMKTDQTW